MGRPFSTQHPEVTPITGEPTRFFVASDSVAEPHLVDLSEYQGNGACSCEQFQFRLQGTLDTGGRDWSEKQSLRCKHLRRAILTYALMKLEEER
jgi:hypothetical protein